VFAAIFWSSEMGPWSFGALGRSYTRQQLETDIQNLTGPIGNIGDLSDAELFGMRDEIRNRQRIVGRAFGDESPLEAEIRRRLADGDGA
jgi:hypothetical protein